MDTIYNLILGGCRFLYSSCQTIFYYTDPINTFTLPINNIVVQRKQIYRKRMKRKNSDYENNNEDDNENEIPEYILEQKPILLQKKENNDDIQVKKIKRTISQEKDLHLFLPNVEVRNRRNSDSNMYYGYFIYIGKHHIKKGDDFEFL